MKRACFVCLFLFLTATFLVPQSNRVTLVNKAAGVASTISAPQPDPKAQAKILDSYGKLPLSFEANHGQADARVKFLSRTSGYMLFLTGDEAVLALKGKKANTRGEIVGTAHMLPSSAAASKGGAVLRMKLRNANSAARATGVDELSGKSNYFIGNDPKKWWTNVPTYAKVKYEGVYSGIDLVYYGSQRQLEYDFIVAPAANPRRIQFDVRGAKRIRQDENGELVFKVGEEEIRWRKPVVYQEKNGTRQEIAARYAITNTNRVRFELTKYDVGRPLYIDPLIYSTYLGGSGDDEGYSIAVDGAGNAYVTGRTASTNFPTTNPLQAANAGGYDVLVAKINASGSTLVYSTYLGGSGNEWGSGIAVDSLGDAYVTGYTTSTNFPTTPGAFQTACGNPSNCNQFGDVFVTEFNPTGSALVYSTYLGGNFGGYGIGIALDGSGDAYVTGSTTSTNFPTTPGAFQTICGNPSFCYDVFVTEFNPTGSALVYSTYLGGSGENGDYGYAIAVDSSGDAYVTGRTDSTNFPTTPGAFQTACGDVGCASGDAFVTEFNPTGSALVYSTYLGGSGSDEGIGIAVNSSGNAYVVGEAYSDNFPVTPGAFKTVCGNPNECSNAFVTEFNSSGSTLVYSTYLGGSGTDYGNGIAVDSSGNAYVTGWTTSTDFPTMNPFQPTYGGGDSDAFVAKINPPGSALVYSTYLGGSAVDGGAGIAVDSSGNAYVIGYTSSTNFPTMNPLQAANAGGPSDAFVTKFDTLTLFPPNLTFANQVVGTSSGPQVSTLTNIGNATLTITSIGVTGANSGDFAETDNCGTSIPVGGSCTISVTFTPAAAGTRNAAVSIADSLSDSPQSLPLTGVGTLPNVTLSPSSLNFGQQPVGTTSQPQFVQFSTNGPLSITSIATSTEFAQTNNCGNGLPAGGSCQISVTFTPTATGVQNGTLTVSDSGAGSPQSVSLTGIGTQPAVTLSPASLNFGNQTVGMTSSPKVSTLMNSGTGTLTITSIGVTGSDSSEFAETNTCGTSVPAGGSCKITVTFTPATTGTQTASVSITDNAPNSPQSIPLSGVGVLPAVAFSPASLTFPNQVVYTKSKAQKVMLTNTGLGILTISSIAATSQFSQTNTCAATLSPKAKCTISVAFAPTTIGPLTGSVSVSDNAPGNPQTVPLNGTGTYVQLKPASLNFGNQPVGTKSLPKKITLTNKGAVTVNITGISITGANASDFAQTNTCGASVASGASCFIKVTFTPVAQGNRTAQVSIGDDGGGSPQTVGLSGTGTP